MNEKVFEFLKYLILNLGVDQEFDDLSIIFNVSVRTIRNYISSIEHYLDQTGFDCVLNVKNNRVSFCSNIEVANKILKSIAESDFYDYKLSSNERRFIISLLLLTSDAFITLGTLEERVCASKVTLLNDIKVISDDFSTDGIIFEKNKRNGYLLNILESKRRDKIYSLIKSLNVSSKDIVEKTSSNICVWFFHNSVNCVANSKRIELALSIVEEHFSLKLTDNNYYDFILFLIICIFRFKNGFLVENDYTATNDNDIANRLSLLIYDTEKDINLTPEISYIAEYLRKKNIYPRSSIINDNQVDYFIITKGFLYKLSEAFGVNLLFDKKLQDFLSAHLIAMDSRFNSGEKLDNPFKSNISANYETEYSSFKKNINYLEILLHHEISEDETAYIFMHIMAAIERLKNNQKIPRVIISCHVGVGTSDFLTESIKKNYKVNIVDVTSFHQLRSEYLNNPHKLIDTCDFIISTTPLVSSPVPYIEVNPILTDQDKNKILKIINDMSTCLTNSDAPQNQISNKSISNYLGNCNNNKIYFTDILELNCIILDKIAIDWMESLIIAGEPLLWNNSVKAEYLQAIVNNVLDNGPYFVFVKGVALAHASPEYGVNKLGVSFLRLKYPVNFGNPNCDPIKFIITISMKESNQELLDMLFWLMNVMSFENVKKMLSDAKTPKDIMEIFKSYEKRE